MNATVMQEQIRRLQRNYNKQYGTESLKTLQVALELAPDSAMQPAVDNLILNYAQLPSPARIMEAVERERVQSADKAAVERERQAAAEKRSQPNIMTQQGVSPLGRDCCDLICHLFTGKIDKRSFLLAADRILTKHNRPIEEGEWIQVQWEELTA